MTTIETLLEAIAVCALVFSVGGLWALVMWSLWEKLK